eukprot:TRINITY_DN12389_c0_g1_i1.p1 TRINITY_DN12389_c0_g1~~TRINITY_DN12389_c0_g1_i1.p1  ORF type:complete len:126 (-),score=18.01 TRINITY_DN12389_c0_g1_i1:30-407(-)
MSGGVSSDEDQLIHLHSEDMINDLELAANQCTASFLDITHSLTQGLAEVTHLTSQYIEVHSNAVKNTCDHVNTSIMASHTLITKASELNSDLQRVHDLQLEIRQLRKVVDTLEPQIKELTREKKR